MRIGRLLPAAALALLLASNVRADELSQLRREFAAIGSDVIPATVSVRSPKAPPGLPSSSGVILTKSGYVLSDSDATLYEVRRGRNGTMDKVRDDDALVRLPAPDGRVLHAVVVKRDLSTDSTLLRITDPVKSPLPVVEVGSSADLKVGDFTVAIGNSFGTGKEGEPALSLGVVCALDEDSTDLAGGLKMIYTSAAVNPGSNGGPLLDVHGRLVGIISTFETDPESPFRAFGKVTPIDRIRAVYASLKKAAGALTPTKRRPSEPRVAQVLQDAFHILLDHVRPSLVSITVDRGGDEGKRRIPTKRGLVVVPSYKGPYSGVVLSADGDVVTAAQNLWHEKHIRSLTVHLADGRSLPAKIVAEDRYRGIALLHVKAKDLVPLPRAGPQDLVVGRFALAMGDPFGGDKGHDPFFTYGIVSDLHRLTKRMDAIQTDAGMNDAMVGGALVTLDGKLMGINILVDPDRFGRNSGVGFAIPMDQIEAVLPQLRAGKDLEPGFLGIGFPATSKGGGLVFTRIVPGGPAAKAGLKRGDKLVAMDGKPASNFKSTNAFLSYLRSKKPGDVVTLTVRRGKKEVQLTITLGKTPGE